MLCIPLLFGDTPASIPERQNHWVSPAWAPSPGQNSLWAYCLPPSLCPILHLQTLVLSWKDLGRLDRPEEMKQTPRPRNPPAVSENKSLIYLDSSLFFFLLCFAFCSFLEVSFNVFSLSVWQLMQDLKTGIGMENKKLPLGNSIPFHMYKVSTLMRIS